MSTVLGPRAGRLCGGSLRSARFGTGRRRALLIEELPPHVPSIAMREIRGDVTLARAQGPARPPAAVSP